MMDNINSDIWGFRLRQFVSNLIRRPALPVLLALLTSNHSFAAQAGCPAVEGQVARALFTTKIDNREPVNRVLILDDKSSEIYFFTELRNMQGHVVVHRWEHNGKTYSQKSFSVKGPRWRVYSSFHLNDDMLGRWTAIVSEQGGCPLKAVVFQYVRAKPDGPGSAIINLK